MAKIYLYDCNSKEMSEMDSLKVAAKDALKLSLDNKHQMIKIDVRDGVYPDITDIEEFSYIPEKKKFGKFNFSSAYGWQENVYVDDDAQREVWSGSFHNNSDFDIARSFSAKWIYLWPIEGDGMPLGMGINQ